MESAALEGVKVFLHRFYVTGPKGVINQSGKAVAGLFTLGFYDAPNIIPVTEADIGYESSAVFARIGAEALTTAATLGLSQAKYVGTGVRVLDTVERHVERQPGNHRRDGRQSDDGDHARIPVRRDAEGLDTGRRSATGRSADRA
jgi:hypothetical protein